MSSINSYSTRFNLIFLILITAIASSCQAPSISKSNQSINTVYSMITKPQVLCAVGDTGSGEEGQRQVGLAMHRFGCTDILLLGDNFYGRGVRSLDDPQWEDKFRAPYRELLEAGTRFHVVLGNHDYMGDELAQIQYTSLPINQFNGDSLWRLPEPGYYSTRFPMGGGLCAFAVDTVAMNDQQAIWLRDQIAQSEGCRWRLVFGHYPVVSRGAHGNTPGATQTLLRPALAGAHLYIAGHDHNFADEGMIPTNETDPQSPRFRQLVVGTGGASLRPVRCIDRACRSRVIAFVFGFAHIDAQEAQLSWTFYDTSLNKRYESRMPFNTESINR